MKTIILAVLFLPLAALATGHHAPPPKPDPKPVAVVATSHSVSDADATAISGSKSSAEGGAADASASQSQTAIGGAANQSQSADNAGNSQAITLNSKYERNAPSVGQGSLYIPQCGAAGNAGGSNTHGSAFLGFAWTPDDCKLLLAAAAYQSLAMYDSACEMLNAVSVVKKRWVELDAKPPSCAVKQETIKLSDYAQPEFDPALFVTKTDAKNFVTKQDQELRDKKMVERLTRK